MPQTKSPQGLTLRQTARFALSHEHPRILGSRSHLLALKQERPQEYKRVIEYARSYQGTEFYPVLAKMVGLGLLYALEGDAQAGREAVDIALNLYIDKQIETGHVTFGHSMARCALVYDLCHPLWTDAEKQRFYDYGHHTIDSNTQEEPSTFHNGWYGYKHWGYGLFAYATMYENPRAKQILDDLEAGYERDAAPALELSGEGGGIAEGYYIHYWLYEWLFFTEAARLCEGVDYYALAPKFFRQRAIASMFEMYPTLDGKLTRRPVPMGDGGGRLRGSDRDKALSSRRILCSYYRNDPEHQVVHTFNESMATAAEFNAIMDFLWHDRSITKGDLNRYKLSHFSKGAGFVYARSSWNDDAAYLFFHCGRRFTAHQHLDNTHFVLFKNEELLGDGGEYDAFDTDHCVNYYLRTIAHNCILVNDPEESWPKDTPQTPKGMRHGPPGVNDGGQNYPWSGTIFRHNGGVNNAREWSANRQLGEIADMLAYEDQGDYVYMAGDATRSYSAKVWALTRQIVFLRPGTFIVFDRVHASDASFKKTFLLQTMAIPQQKDGKLVVTSANGRIFVQSLLPEQTTVEMYHGEQLYVYNGTNHPATHTTGPAPLCRVEISPQQSAAQDFFLHVMTTTDASVNSVPGASVKLEDGEAIVTIEGISVRFSLGKVGGSISVGGTRRDFAQSI